MSGKTLEHCKHTNKSAACNTQDRIRLSGQERQRQTSSTPHKTGTETKATCTGDEIDRLRQDVDDCGLALLPIRNHDMLFCLSASPCGHVTKGLGRVVKVWTDLFHGRTQGSGFRDWEFGVRDRDCGFRYHLLRR